MKLRQWSDAKTKYDQGIALNSNDGKAYFNRAIVLSNLGNQRQSKADLEKAQTIFLTTGDQANYQRVKKYLMRQ
ncbi:MAG: tetratricopeptide repeat protein [Cyanobacteria bacterium P01_G01_bin.39]